MTDDRMDRARRIREMREGNRPDAQSDDSTDAAAESTDAADDAETTAESTADSGDTAAADSARASRDDAVTTADSGSEAGQAADSGPDPDASPAPAAGASSDDGGGGTMHIPGAEVGDVEVDVEELARAAGLDSGAVETEVTEDAPDQRAVPGADEEVAGVGMASARAANAGVETTVDETRVLEFNLGDERYCLDIEHVEEIVKRETVTRVPNTPDYVEGVVDLRGQITTILDPKDLLDIDAEGTKDLIVVFDPEGFEDQGAIGWVVDDVNQVTPIAEDEVNDSPVDQDGINGVVERDGEFVIWTTPELALDEAAA